MHRRCFIRKTGMIAVAAICVGAGSKLKPHKDLFDRYLYISKKLTAAADLDRAVAQQYFTSLSSTAGDKASLADLYVYLKDGKTIPSERQDLKKLSKDILYQWYTGIVKTNGREDVVNYFGSMVWTSLDFAKPQGMCG